ncbi:MAG: aminodeoxychorismate synthase component I [Anaerolineales bacterium]|nr:aminodeoxychorismate synthase component I [Anaerolineales bacterium]
MIETNEILLKQGADWLYFSKPYQIITTQSAEEIEERLEAVENLVNENNWYAAGFVSYEAAKGFDQNLRVLDTNDFPVIWFGLYPQPEKIKLPSPNSPLEALRWQANVKPEIYNSSIQKIKEYIAGGKTYQVNYTMRLQTDFLNEAWDFFLHLAQSQNKYGAYLNMERHAICSASPELFFELDGDLITSKPMKGTVKRGRTTSEDLANSAWLRASEKNRAENVMIVDMLRNDIGKVAQIGSVQAPKLFEVETYPTLFQLTSTVQAKTHASLTKIFKALFPCASITGAPKVSAMQIIAELENSPRKIYTGSIGFVAPNRKAQFNVAIRTALVDKKKQTAEYGVGGGIVWDSESGDEYNEAILKARILSKPYQEFSLLETLLWTPSDGYFLLAKHLARMADSAKYFNFPFSENSFINLLDEIKPKFASPQRLRILLNPAGRLTYEASAFISEEKILQSRLAKEAINSTDIFYFHKTTRREIYPAEAGYDDILLFNEKAELTEFTIGNLVVKIEGELYTPPVSCGLLSGTYRAHLLETGRVAERSVSIRELKNCEEIFRINSVRKWEKVKLA